MRTLTVAMLALLAAGCPSPDPEICNQVDDDGDGSVDEEHVCPDRFEVCDNGVDDDGDGFTDCDDSSCDCGHEICDDGIDNNEDGLVDCEDTAACGEIFDCNPVELWSFGGVGHMSGSSYSGTLFMLDEVVNNVAGTFDNGDILCEAHYVHDSTGAPTTPCEDCDWAFAMTNPAPLDTSFNSTGYQQPSGTTYCNDWYDFTDATADNYFGEVDWSAAFGFDSTYTYGGNTYAVAMSFSADNGWGYSGLATFDSTTGAFEWALPVGYYAY